MFARICAAGLVCVLATPALGAQLANKTVTVSFSLSPPEGAGRPLNITRTIYVSGKGRVFVRSTRELAGASDTTDRGPGTGTYRIAGGKIVGVYQLAHGANQLTVSFDPSYTSCTASIQHGRASRANYANPLPGGKALYSATAPRVSGVSCSVREGNPF